MTSEHIYNQIEIEVEEGQLIPNEIKSFIFILTIIQFNPFCNTIYIYIYISTYIYIYILSIFVVSLRYNQEWSPTLCSVYAFLGQCSTFICCYIFLWLISFVISTQWWHNFSSYFFFFQHFSHLATSHHTQHIHNQLTKIKVYIFLKINF